MFGIRLEIWNEKALSDSDKELRESIRNQMPAGFAYYSGTIGRAASSALRVHEYMQEKPLVGIGAVAEELKLSIPTVTVALDHMVRLGIAKEVTGKRPSSRLRIHTLSEDRE